MKILITGDRNWSDIDVVIRELSAFPRGTVLIHGACKGADVMCAAVGEQLGFTMKSYPADWATYKRAAGPVRNQEMLDKENVPEEPIDECIAFHNDISNSKGTRDMLKRAVKANIPKITLVTSSSRHTISNVPVVQLDRTAVS